MNARHRVSKMLLRHGRVYPKPSSTWSKAHRQWLGGPQFPDPISELAYVDLLAAVDGLTARKLALAERISRLATDPEWWPIVARVALLSRHRHAHCVQRASRTQRRLEPVREGRAGRVQARSDPVTRTVRRVRPPELDHQDRINARSPAAGRRRLVYAREPRIGVTLAERQAGQPAHVLQIANRAQHRIHRVYTRMRSRGKPHNVTVVARARELACFLWAAASTLTLPHRPPVREGGAPGRDAAGTHAPTMSSPSRGHARS